MVKDAKCYNKGCVCPEFGKLDTFKPPESQKKGGVPRIQHFVKVHDFATTIAMLENVDPSTLSILEAASVLHDIGIHLSEEKYGNHTII